MRHGLWMGFLVLGLAFAACADAATCTWGGSSGNWSAGANWSGCGGAAPGAADTAVVNSGTPQVDAPSTVAGLTITGGGLGGAQNLNVSTAFVWSAGSLSGPDLSAELILDAGCTSTFGPSGSGRSISNRTLRNRGTFNRADSTGTITLSNAAEIINEGVWNGGASNWIATGSGAGIKRFTNAVGAQYNHASGNSYLAVEVINNGTLAVAGGILRGWRRHARWCAVVVGRWDAGGAERRNQRLQRCHLHRRRGVAHHRRRADVQWPGVGAESRDRRRRGQRQRHADHHRRVELVCERIVRAAASPTR
ncbi:MAG: hypothetical protein IPH76_08050 [Xanthomonadales bacterium]|nr:hypothetical protein [Xanthomonadales bacterium]